MPSMAVQSTEQIMVLVLCPEQINVQEVIIPTMDTVRSLAKQLISAAAFVETGADVDTADALGALMAQVIDAMIVVRFAIDRDAEAVAERHRSAMEEYSQRTGFHPDLQDISQGWGSFV